MPPYYEILLSGEKDEDRLWFTDAAENARVAKENPTRFRRYYMKQDGYSRSSFQLLRMMDLSPYRTCVDLGGKHLSFLNSLTWGVINDAHDALK